MPLEDIKNKVYYAQNREDLILEAFFPDTQVGFYVDVGAYDPDCDSVTKLFYQKGWRGINIEPQQKRYKKFLRSRSRDINVNAGIGARNGFLQLRSYKNNGLSTFSPVMRDEYVVLSSPDTDSYEDVKTQVYTLRSLFQKYKVLSVDFLKVDVEGFEYEVLEGNDWDKYRPKVICLESNHMVKNWKKYLTSQDYTFIFFDGLNEYYADARDESVSKSFSYVDHIIMKRGGGIAYRDYKQLKKLQSALNGKIREIENLQSQVLQEVAEKDRLRADVNRLEGVLGSVPSMAKILIKRVLGFKEK